MPVLSASPTQTSTQVRFANKYGPPLHCRPAKVTATGLNDMTKGQVDARFGLERLFKQGVMPIRLRSARHDQQ